MFHSRMHATRQHISTDQPLRGLDATNRHPHTPTACSGACLDGYTYNSKLQICVACEENERHIIDLFTPVFALGGTSAAVVFAAYSQRKRARRWFAKIDVGRFRRWRTAMMSREKLKILYVTYQIVCSTAFTLDGALRVRDKLRLPLTAPPPLRPTTNPFHPLTSLPSVRFPLEFANFLEGLDVVTFDMFGTISIGCYKLGIPTYLAYILISSFTPMILAVSQGNGV
jgi:hypothetical protein